MIVIALALIGGLIGAFRARQRNGKGFDIAQYAASYGIMFAIFGLFITVFVEKNLH